LEKTGLKESRRSDRAGRRPDHVNAVINAQADTAARLSQDQFDEDHGRQRQGRSTHSSSPNTHQHGRLMDIVATPSFVKANDRSGQGLMSRTGPKAVGIAARRTPRARRSRASTPTRRAHDENATQGCELANPDLPKHRRIRKKRRPGHDQNMTDTVNFDGRIWLAGMQGQGQSDPSVLTPTTICRRAVRERRPVARSGLSWVRARGFAALLTKNGGGERILRPQSWRRRVAQYRG